MYIKKISGPTIDPLGTPDNTGAHFECWTTTFCCLLLKKLSKTLSNFPEILRVPNLYEMIYYIKY